MKLKKLTTNIPWKKMTSFSWRCIICNGLVRIDEKIRKLFHDAETWGFLKCALEILLDRYPLKPVANKSPSRCFERSVGAILGLRTPGFPKDAFWRVADRIGKEHGHLHRNRRGLQRNNISFNWRPRGNFLPRNLPTKLAEATNPYKTNWKQAMLADAVARCRGPLPE